MGARANSAPKQRAPAAVITKTFLQYSCFNGTFCYFFSNCGSFRILRLIPRLKVEGQQLLLQQHLCGRHHPQQILQTTYLRYLEEVLIIPNSITLLLQFGSFNLHFVDLCSFSSHVI
jgi:hypothetical protein